jgi:drug/metabolite transporter (DMT)-like permease
MNPNKSPGIYDHPYLLLTLAVFFWSVNFIVGRAVRADIPPVALAFWRWAVASVLVLFLARPHLREDWPRMRGHVPLLLLLSVLGVSAFNTLVYTGLQQTIALNAFLMQSLMPVLIVGLSFLIFRETITGVQTLGIGISLCGAVTIIAQGDPEVLLGLSINRGDLLFFTAVVCYAGYSVMLRKRPPIHPLSFLAVTFVTGALILLPLYLWETVYIRPFLWSGKAVLAVGYVAVFPSIVSYFCFNRGVELAGANRAGLFLHLMPVFGSIMAVLFLGESLAWFHGAGIAAIAVGIYLTTRVGRPRCDRAEETRDGSHKLNFRV